MFGSLFYNFWCALVAFTLYFVMNIQSAKSPIHIILFALLWAVIAFILMFFVRIAIAYIFSSTEMQEQLDEQETNDMKTPTIDSAKKDLVDPKDAQSEEIANVVKTMIHQDDK